MFLDVINYNYIYTQVIHTDHSDVYMMRHETLGPNEVYCVEK